VEVCFLRLQNSNPPLQVTIVKTEEEIDKLLDSPVIEIQDICPLTPEILRITYKDSSLRKQHPITNNVPIGVFVTSYARLHLYSFMRRVGDRLLYVGKCFRHLHPKIYRFQTRIRWFLFSLWASHCQFRWVCILAK
jgi:hypothetical protein